MDKNNSNTQKKTSKIRLKFLQSREHSTQDYIKLYSTLEPQGYTLVRINENNFFRFF